MPDPLPSVLSPLPPNLFGVQKDVLPKIQGFVGDRLCDLLLHLPNGVIDRTNLASIATAPSKTEDGHEAATMKLLVGAHSPKPHWKSRKPYEITLTDGTGSLKAIFFAAGAWLQKAFPVGEEVIVHGKINTTKNGHKTMAHPQVWPAKKGEEEVARLWPKYAATAGVSQPMLTRAVQSALAVCPPVKDWLPKELLEKQEWPHFTDAIARAHTLEEPEDTWAQTPFRNRLAYDELLSYQITLQHARRLMRSQPGFALVAATPKTRQFIENLPFALTTDQKRTLTEIKEDMALPVPMLRLVQGDVGSGKTVVGLAALLAAVENGTQGALLAPTEILARQHHENACKLLQPLGINVGLLVGGMTAKQKADMKTHLQSGLIQIIVGTHALVQETVRFEKLGLAVIDEQHRFGVKQRLELAKANGEGRESPDMLLMTATPIPRTLALTAYGDMDVSLIQTKPPGRTPIITNAVPKERLMEVQKSLSRALEKGEQVYWVVPRVEEDEDAELKLTSAEERFKTLKAIYGDRVALLHGKMKAADKDAVMLGFKNHETDILVSTTVIEVGVDVPNATIMVIEHAERFGLSQLHQLRGRVGRGSLQSHCLLLYANNLTEQGMARLQAMRESEDGFYLAEQDLELRGPGEILGTKQSGDTRTRIVHPTFHRDLIPLAQEHARKVLSGDLPKAEQAAFNTLLAIFNRGLSASDVWRAG